MNNKSIDFTIDEYSVYATGEYCEITDTVLNIEYECNMPVDEAMDNIILDFSDRLLKEKFHFDELEFY